jgi:hypothetical protein
VFHNLCVWWVMDFGDGDPLQIGGQCGDDYEIWIQRDGITSIHQKGHCLMLPRKPRKNVVVSDGPIVIEEHWDKDVKVRKAEDTGDAYGPADTTAPAEPK